MINFNFYAHGGSENHGCEAIVRGTINVLKEIKGNTYLYSFGKEQDEQYNLNNIITNILEYHQPIQRNSISFLINYALNKILKSKRYYFYNQNKLLIKKNKSFSVYFSIGGDNYCYGDYYKELAYVNKKLIKKGKTILWGCSIEPSILSDDMLISDLKLYSLITTRESITYNALKNAGISNNVRLFPDPAFTLDKIELPLPSGFIKDKTIGINVSPMIIENEINKGMALVNYEKLIEFIINKTGYQIALIPHVIWGNSNDLKPLTQLHNKYKDTGRILLLGDYNCMELKGFISRCRMFIGARTHATIAAYSSCVPTLVVGYSVKAKGIAKDIFGTYENYVLPVQSLQNEDDLIKAFEWLKDNEDSIKKHLIEFMPSYIEKAWQAGDEIKKLLEEKNP